MKDLIGIIIMIVCVFIITTIDTYNRQKTEIEFAKQGLQQCTKNGKILWQKECEN